MSTSEQDLGNSIIDNCARNSVWGLIPLGPTSVPIRSHCSLIGRCPRYLIRP
ncbi:hypothetical protein T08_3838 [Trichinella sp. T8]|nr:hypothetical protein T08_3838 [Trichinella sp. T8]